jgi:RimJ/RimL family protein N-acetyltransferase
MDLSPRIPRLQTERLLLREWRTSDLEPFAALNADPAVMEHFVAPLSREASDGLVARVRAGWAANGYGLWAVERTTDGRFLGFTGLALHTFDAPFTPAVEIGWRFAAEAWGHGYATEAATAAVRFGFETVRLDEILSWTTVANQPSRRVMKRLGMTRSPADDFDHPSIPMGHPIRRHVLYRLARSDWLDRVRPPG